MTIFPINIIHKSAYQRVPELIYFIAYAAVI